VNRFPGDDGPVIVVDVQRGAFQRCRKCALTQLGRVTPPAETWQIGGHRRGNEEVKVRSCRSPLRGRAGIA